MLRIATRGSKLALCQAREVVASLQAVSARPTEFVIFRTRAEHVLDRPLAEVGGKGLFTREIDLAVSRNDADIAVHSLKDLETEIASGLCLAAVLPRADYRDAFISPHARSLDELPYGATVGSASVRRKAQLLHKRPDLNFVLLRGNVDTRLNRVKAGEMSATILAMAGLMRLGRTDEVTSALEPEFMLPAVAQGAIGITCRSDDRDTCKLLSRINHRPSQICVTAERAMLHRIDGSCRTPVAALATFRDHDIRLRGMVLSEDGRQCASCEKRGSANSATELGFMAGDALLARAGTDLFGSRVD